MTTSIGSVGNLPIGPLRSVEALGAKSAASGVSFQDMLLKSLEQTSHLQQQSQSGIDQLLTGGDVTGVEVVSAMKEADLALRMMVQIRNKVLEAYDEVQQMRM